MATLKLPTISGGINLSDLEHKINDNQSPSMKNLWYKNRTLSKRWGQTRLLFTDGANPVTLTSVTGMSAEFEGYVCVHADKKLYKWDIATNVLTDLNVDASDNESAFTEFNGNLYCFDGAEIWVIDADWTCAAVVPYAPVVYINCAPDLSASAPDEPFNILGAGFRVWYNGDGATAVYNLPVTDIDDTEITITADGNELVEDTHFTVDRTAGTIDFDAGTAAYRAPDKDTNNVRVTAYKTVDKTKITACTVAVPFGGEASSIHGGTRLFVMGNPSYPRTYWYSDLGASQSHGAEYFPDTQYEELTQNNDAITAAAKQAGDLIILKEKSLFSIGYQTDGEQAFYPVREFNAVIGCDIPKSVQLVDNNLVFANTYGGVFVVVNTSSSAEENVKPISNNINGAFEGLLQEPSLTAATSVDHDRKYWLCVNGNVYMWDYDLTPFINYSDVMKSQRRLAWFKLDNIPALYWLSAPTANETGLWYSDGANVNKFVHVLSDFGNGIEAWWRSKSFDFKEPAYQKLVKYVVPSIRADSNSKMSVTISNETKTAYYTKEIEIESFTWAISDWTIFTWNVQRFSKPYRLKPKMKKKYYCQVWVTNNDAGYDMGITDLEINYEVTRMVK